MSVSDCIKSLNDEIKFLTPDELNNFASELISIAKKDGKAAAKKAMEDRLELSYFSKATETALNNIKFNKNLSAMAKSGNIRDTLTFTGGTLQNKGNCVEAAQASYKNILGKILFDGLGKDEINNLLTEGIRDNEIATALDDLMSGNESSSNPQITKIAKNIKRYIEYVRNAQVSMHLLDPWEVNENRFLNTSHNADKMAPKGLIYRRLKGDNRTASRAYLDAKSEWVNYIYSKLDLEKMFSKKEKFFSNGAPNESSIKALFENTYDSIIQGKNNALFHNGILTDLEAVEKRSRMFFKFKNAKDWVEYEKKYGNDTILMSALKDIHSQSAKFGMTEIYGTKPLQMLELLKKEGIKAGVKGIIPSLRDGLVNVNNIFEQLTGEAHVVHDRTISKISSNIRTISAMSRLWTLVFNSIGDINLGAAVQSQRLGINYFKGMLNQMEALFGQASSKDVKIIANQMHMELNSHMGYMSRYNAFENMGKFTHWVSSKYFYWNGTYLWDRGNKLGPLLGLYRRLGELSENKFEELPSIIKKTLGQHDITSKDWDEIRSKPHFSDGTKLVGLHDDLSPDTYRKMFALGKSLSDSALPTPTAFEKALMFGESRAGTIYGELRRMAFQFKGFPITHIHRQLVQNYKNADTIQAKLNWGLQNFVYTLPLAVASEYFYNVSKGLGMPDTDSPAFWEKMALSSLSSFTSVLEPDNEGINLLKGLFNSPSLSVIQNAISVPIALASGNYKNAGQEAKKIVEGLFPLYNFPFASPYIKAALGEKVYRKKGQEQIYGK